MGSPQNLVKKKFGRLTVKRLGPNRGNARTWECRCSCGAVVFVKTASLNNGNTKSCGCYVVDAMRELKKTHGQSRSRGRTGKTGAYASWAAMRWRCTTTRMPTFGNYRFRGITWCREWDCFEVFYADMGDRPIGKSLDRVDNDGGYSKNNCRWATPIEQRLNQRRSAHRTC